MEAPAVLDTRFFRFTLHPEDGRYEILDKQSDVTWRSGPRYPRFGQVVLAGGDHQALDLSDCEAKTTPAAVEMTFRPVPGKPEAALRVTAHSMNDGRTLQLAYEAGPGLEVESVRLLDDALWVTDVDRGYAVVPVREGLLIPADSGREYTQSFDTYAYEGCHMEMVGLVKGGSMCLVIWHDPYVTPELRSSLGHPPSVTGNQLLSLSVSLRKTAHSLRLHFGGKGDFMSLARDYRQVAKGKGYLVSWDQKLRGQPDRAKLIGSINYKLWSVLDRRMSEDASRETALHLNWTFDEAAEVAEHLKRDLKLDKVLFTVGGWIHRGYDNQHPDVLPAAPECGGDKGLADCAKRVMGLGYLFCLHDNYQDMYRDAPSWDESYLQKSPDGKPALGGIWAGGRAYLTCAKRALDLARRPQNLPAVRSLTHANSYFIDTTYAAGLQECYDAQHPLSRWEDMKWKQALSDYARELYGVFGSECGREWAIPHADFFEGLTGVSGTYYHDAGLPERLGATVIPLFEAVYRDTIAAYGKYGYDVDKSAEYVLHHLLIGRTLNYHGIPAHLYWTQPSEPEKAAGTAGDPGLFARGQSGWASGMHPMDRFVKNTYEVLSPLNELTARMHLTDFEFLTKDRMVRRSTFGEGKHAYTVTVNLGKQPYTCHSPLGGDVVLPEYGFLVEGPGFTAFHALSWCGHVYERPVLFTLRSQDGRPLGMAATVRVFHAFGDPHLSLGGEAYEVAREAIVTAGGGR
ncbi:MAG TPA: DUF5696 domain-containing protein [Armatimonadota bacterium]|jgi:hypothetical protein